MIDDRMIWSVDLLGRGVGEPRERRSPPTPTGPTSATRTSATTVPTVGIPLRSPWPRICRSSSPTGDQRLMTRVRGEVAPR
jgi:hypothetical protein